MKRFVNGHEVELDPAGATIRHTADRLMVGTPEGAFSAVAVRQGDRVLISYHGRQYIVERARTRARTHGAAGTGELHAPMPGLIVDVLATEGDAVLKGHKILVLEAMKTQQAFTSPFDGTITKLTVQKGQQVAEGDIMAVVEEQPTEGE